MDHCAPVSAFKPVLITSDIALQLSVDDVVDVDVDVNKKYLTFWTALFEHFLEQLRAACSIWVFKKEGSQSG